MKIFPRKDPGWWDVVFLPFRMYVVLAPVAFFVWDSATTGFRVRGAWEGAAGTLGVGYIVCFLVLLVGGLFVWAVRNIDAAGKYFFFMLLAFLFPFLIVDRGCLLAVAISIFTIGFEFARDPRKLKTAERNEEAFECPVCRTSILASEQVCPRCAWTYLVRGSTSTTRD